MSVFIRGGYYAFSNKLLNIRLKPTNVWHTGLVLTNKNKFISNLNPSRENKLELLWCKNTAVLLLNNSIIYEDKKLFTYQLNLALTPADIIWSKERFASCIDYEWISCKSAL